jgi:hypothetical protein
MMFSEYYAALAFKRSRFSQSWTRAKKTSLQMPVQKGEAMLERRRALVVHAAVARSGSVSSNSIVAASSARRATTP